MIRLYGVLRNKFTLPLHVLSLFLSLCVHIYAGEVVRELGDDPSGPKYVSDDII